MWKITVVFLFLAFPQGAFAAESKVAEPKELKSVELSELRMRKRFGVGFSAAGPLSILGMEIDVNLTENFSIGAGIGTGLDYSTFMVKGRYFLLGEAVSPYVAAGFARWQSDGSTPTRLAPSMLTQTFLAPGYDVTQGFEVLLVYPAIGVQFMHVMGMSVYAEAQYLFKLFDFANGLYAGMGIHWYF